MTREMTKTNSATQLLKAYNQKVRQSMKDLAPLPKATLDLIAECEEIRRLIDEDEDIGMLKAAHRILALAKNAPQEVQITPQFAHQTISSFVDSLLQADQFEAAATILWPTSYFDWRPNETRRVWEAVIKWSKVLVPGAQGLGKSYAGAAIFYLLWRQDPKYTSVKVISATKEHATKNIFANLKAYHQNACVSPLCQDLAESIQVGNDKKYGITLTAIPKGESGAGVLRGFHPSPRIGREHPKFGRLTRNFVILDEAEEIPPGVWEGVDNLLSTINKETSGHIKVYADTNPKDRTSAFGKRCEPKRGWGSVDPDIDHDWISRDGYHVVRLDAKFSANVVERREVFPGMQSYEGYAIEEAKGNSASYWTYARGWFPSEGISMQIISHSSFEGAVGVLNFIPPVTPLASADLALEGNDQLRLSYGRFGLCDGWTPLGSSFVKFSKPRVALQLDSQISLPRGDTVTQTRELMRICKDLSVNPSWFCVDRTGNGSGVHDNLRTLFGDVMGVNYSTMSTDTLIFKEDTKKCNELYDGIVTELLFALGKFMEFGLLKIAPGFRNEELVRQATSRRYRQVKKGRTRCESKKEYCSRTRQKSPDDLDSLSLFVHLFRMREKPLAAMNTDLPKPKGERPRIILGIEDAGDPFIDLS